MSAGGALLLLLAALLPALSGTGRSAAGREAEPAVYPAGPAEPAGPTGSAGSAGSTGSTGSARSAGLGVFPVGQRTVVRAPAGGTALLECTVRAPPGVTVSWVRVRDVQVVAHAGAVFSGDARVRADRRGAAGEQRHALRVQPVRAADAGRYECQLNTDPKQGLLFDLVVADPADAGGRASARVWGAAGGRAARGGAVAARAGGSAVLHCAAQHEPPESPAAPPLDVRWVRAGDDDGDAYTPVTLQEAGVSLETSRSEGRVTSRLLLSGLRARHAGRYACRVLHAPDGPDTPDGPDAPDAPDPPDPPDPADVLASAELRLIVQDTPENHLEAMQRDQSAAAGAPRRAAPAPLAAPLAALLAAPLAALLAALPRPVAGPA